MVRLGGVLGTDEAESPFELQRNRAHQYLPGRTARVAGRSMHASVIMLVCPGHPLIQRMRTSAWTGSIGPSWCPPSAARPSSGSIHPANEQARTSVGE